jgi:hypothetical protein
MFCGRDEKREVESVYFQDFSQLLAWCLVTHNGTVFLLKELGKLCCIFFAREALSTLNTSSITILPLQPPASLVKAVPIYADHTPWH